MSLERWDVRDTRPDSPGALNPSWACSQKHSTLSSRLGLGHREVTEQHSLTHGQGQANLTFKKVFKQAKHIQVRVYSSVNYHQENTQIKGRHCLDLSTTVHVSPGRVFLTASLGSPHQLSHA